MFGNKSVGGPIDWNALADRKYANMEYEARTGRIAADANAGLARANTAMVAPLGLSQIGLEGARGMLTRTQNRLAPGLAAAEIANTNANTATLNTQRPFIGPRTLAEIRLSDSQVRGNNATTTQQSLQNYMTREWTNPASQALYESLTGDPRFGYGMGYRDQNSGYQFAKGTARVPGVGDGTVDKVPATLAPGEAVLNKPAAEMMGRGLIAVMNKLGMQKMGMV